MADTRNAIARGDIARQLLEDPVMQEAFLRGLILLPCGTAAIRIIPPLCINKMQLEVGLNVLEEAIATVAP